MKAWLAKVVKAIKPGSLTFPVPTGAIGVMFIFKEEKEAMTFRGDVTDIQEIKVGASSSKKPSVVGWD